MSSGLDWHYFLEGLDQFKQQSSFGWKEYVRHSAVASVSDLIQNIDHSLYELTLIFI